LSEASAGEREGNAEMTDFGLLFALLSSDCFVAVRIWISGSKRPGNISVSGPFLVAGAEGLEPSTKVLENFA